MTKKKIAELERLRDALVAADTSQSEAIGARVSAGAGKSKLLVAIRKDVTRLHKRAESIYRGKKAALAEFKSRIGRHAPKPRARKPAAPATTGT